MELWDNDRRLAGRVNYMRAKVMIGGQLGRKVTLRSEAFTGVKTIGLFFFKESTSCCVDIELEVGDGRAKLIMVRKGLLTTLISETGKLSRVMKFERGFSRLRIVGEHASLKMNFVLTKGITSIE